jgi:enoyl-CoA hydratase/carnithine racemase
MDTSGSSQAVCARRIYTEGLTIGTVEFEIGFIAEHSLILFLTHILKCSNPLWLALSQALAFAYFPCSECCT